MTDDGDGIGELLDEVERRFCSPSRATPTSVSMVNRRGNSRPTVAAVIKPVAKSRSTPASHTHSHSDYDIEDLDKIISEIISEPDEGAPPGTRGRVRGTRSSPAVTTHPN